MMEVDEGVIDAGMIEDAAAYEGGVDGMQVDAAEEGYDGRPSFPALSAGDMEVRSLFAPPPT